MHTECIECQHSNIYSIGDWQRINGKNVFMVMNTCTTCIYGKVNNGACELFDKKEAPKV